MDIGHLDELGRKRRIKNRRWKLIWVLNKALWLKPDRVIWLEILFLFPLATWAMREFHAGSVEWDVGLGVIAVGCVGCIAVTHAGYVVLYHKLKCLLDRCLAKQRQRKSRRVPTSVA